MGYPLRTSRYRYTEWIDLRITSLLKFGAAIRTEWTVLVGWLVYDFAQGHTKVENIVRTAASARIIEELAELLRVKTHGPRTRW
jgi:hypothetical protein